MMFYTQHEGETSCTLNTVYDLNILNPAPIELSKGLVHVTYIAVIPHYIKQLTYGV